MNFEDYKLYLLDFDTNIGLQKCTDERLKDAAYLLALVLHEDHWKLLISLKYDEARLLKHLSACNDSDKSELFKFGISCLINFIQSNFTGPDLADSTEEFLQLDKIPEQIDYRKRLALNNEDININTKFPCLLYAAKVIFKLFQQEEEMKEYLLLSRWWEWRSLTIHQQVMDELSPALLSTADQLAQEIEWMLTGGMRKVEKTDINSEEKVIFRTEEMVKITPVKLKVRLLAKLHIEQAQLYIIYRNVSKSAHHINTAKELLGLRHELEGRLGRRTNHQQHDVAQLTVRITLNNKRNNNEQSDLKDKSSDSVDKNSEDNSKDVEEVGKEYTAENGLSNDEDDEYGEELKSIPSISAHVAQNLTLKDDVRMDQIKFSDLEQKSEDKTSKISKEVDADEIVKLPNTEQQLIYVMILQQIMSRPTEDLFYEELQPFFTVLLNNQPNTWTLRVATLLLRCKLEHNHKRTIERSLLQCEEVINCMRRADPPALARIGGVFAVGVTPMWRTAAMYANLMLGLGLVKASLEIFLKLQLWEEVIMCYTVLNMRQKAAQVIQAQLNVQPSVKLYCWLGDALDKESCYETAWEWSKKRSHRAQRHWGFYLFSKREYQKSIPHLEKSVSINPLQSVVWSKLGFAALQEKNWQVAATAYRRYTTLEPDAYEAWNNLAQAYLKLGNKRSAHHALAEALRCNYDHWKVWENFLVLSADVGQWFDVIRSYHRLLDLKAGGGGKYLNADVLSALIRGLCEEGEEERLVQRARELLGRITSLHPTNGRVWECYALVSPNSTLRLQRLQRAYRAYTQTANWNQTVRTCESVLNVCLGLAEIVLGEEEEPLAQREGDNTTKVVRGHGGKELCRTCVESSCENLECNRQGTAGCKSENEKAEGKSENEKTVCSNEKTVGNNEKVVCNNEKTVGNTVGNTVTMANNSNHSLCQSHPGHGGNIVKGKQPQISNPARDSMNVQSVRLNVSSALAAIKLRDDEGDITVMMKRLTGLLTRLAEKYETMANVKT